jgi:YbbR domain-containing protein
VRELLRAVFSNGWSKLLSVALAVAIWLYVQGAEVDESRITAQVVWSLPTKVVPVVPPPTSVTLVVKGTRAATRAARTAAVRMVADVSQYARGAHEVDLSTFPVEGLPKTVERSGVVPAVVDLTLDELVSRKLRVRAEVVGEPATGFAVAAITLEPARIEVEGPRTTMDGLSELVTRPIDVNGLAVTTMRPVELDLPPGVFQAGDAKIAAQVEVLSRIERREVSDVPIFVRGSDRYAPAPGSLTVSLEGPAAALAGLDAGRMAAFVVLPPTAEKARYEAWLGPRGGVRVEVLHGGGDSVKVTAIAPPSVVVEVR